MEISGKIIAVLPATTGQGKNGQWTSQDAVLETAEQYPKKVCFNMFNDKIVPVQIDQQVKVSFDVESSEYNGRWYTKLRAWKVEVSGATTTQNSPAPIVPPTASEDSDLPF